MIHSLVYAPNRFWTIHILCSYSPSSFSIYKWRLLEEEWPKCDLSHYAVHVTDHYTLDHIQLGVPAAPRIIVDGILLSLMELPILFQSIGLKKIVGIRHSGLALYC